MLGKRQWEVLQLIAEGKSNKEIAAILSLEESTVKTYVQIIFRKLKVGNRVEAVRWLIERGAYPFHKILQHGCDPLTLEIKTEIEAISSRLSRIALELDQRAA